MVMTTATIMPANIGVYSGASAAGAGACGATVTRT